MRQYLGDDICLRDAQCACDRLRCHRIVPGDHPRPQTLRLQAREDKLAKHIERAEAEGARFEEVRRQTLATTAN